MDCVLEQGLVGWQLSLQVETGIQQPFRRVIRENTTNNMHCIRSEKQGAELGVFEELFGHTGTMLRAGSWLSSGVKSIFTTNSGGHNYLKGI